MPRHASNRVARTKTHTGVQRYRIDLKRLAMPLVQECGWVYLRQSSPLPDHRNNGYEITFAMTGSVVWEIKDGPALRLNGREVCLMQPRISHRGQHDLIAPVDLFYVVVDPLRSDATINAAFTTDELRAIDKSWRAHGNRVVRASETLLEQMRRIRELLRQGAQQTSLLTYPEVRAVICQIIVSATLCLEASPARPFSPAIGQAIKLIESSADEPLRMDVFADKVGLSRSRFFELFREITGLTPADYLQRLRCLRAAQALTATGDEITTIALRNGFSSSQYFSKCFRKYLGTTPSAYRARRR